MSLPHHLVSLTEACRYLEISPAALVKLVSNSLLSNLTQAGTPVYYRHELEKLRGGTDLQKLKEHTLLREFRAAYKRELLSGATTVA